MEDGLFPYEIDYPTGDIDDNIPSWPNVIDDAVSRGKYYLRVSGGTFAHQAVAEDLKYMISHKHWRAEEAAKVLLRIQKAMAAEAICAMQLVSTSA